MAILTGIRDFLGGVFEAPLRFIAGAWGTLTGHSLVGSVLVVAGLAAVGVGVALWERRKGNR